MSVCTGRFRKVWTRLVAGAGTARTTRDKTREDVWGDAAITEATPLEERRNERVLVLNHRGHTTVRGWCVKCMNGVHVVCICV